MTGLDASVSSLNVVREYAGTTRVVVICCPPLSANVAETCRSPEPGLATITRPLAGLSAAACMAGQNQVADSEPAGASAGMTGAAWSASPERERARR